MKVFHGWKMVAAGAGLQFLQAGLLHQAFGAYFAALTVEKGWSRTSISAAAALQSAEAALIGPILGWVIDRYGARNLIRAGVVVMGLGFSTLGWIETLFGFYGAVLMIALGSSLCGFFPLNAAIIHWFERRRARALSFVGLGLALGGVITPAVAATMDAIGWRQTAMASGIVIIIVGWPLAGIFRRRPEDHGDHIDGIAPSQALTDAAGLPLPAPVIDDLSAREAIRTGAFWLVSIGHAIALLVVTAVNVHAINHMRESLGYSVGQAAWFITLMTILQVAGVLTGSVIGDRYDKRWIAAICMLSHAFGLAMLAFATGPAMLVAFAVFHGVAWGIRGPLMQAIRADFFGRRAIGKILGLSTLITAIGQILGPMVAGAMADATGDYRFGLTLLAAVAVGGSLMFLLARSPRPQPPLAGSRLPKSPAVEPGAGD
jgi:MFS family permease